MKYDFTAIEKKWLLNDPDIIILDEPTRGIDVGAKRDIYLLIGSLVQQGKAFIMMILSEMDMASDWSWVT